MIGQFSDNLRTRLGRRHPLMYLSAIPVAVSFFFLWLPPEGWSNNATLGYFFVMTLIVRTAITFYEIPSSALVPEMTDDYDQRTSYLSWRSGFALTGAMIISFVTYYFLLHDTGHTAGQMNAAGYMQFAALAAVAMVISILVSTRGTQRYVPLFSQQASVRKTIGQILREMLASFSNRHFLVLLGAAIFGTLAIGLGASLHLFFNTYYWGLTTKQISYFTATTLGAIVFAPFFATYLSRRMGKNNAALLFYFTCVTVMVSPYILRLIGFFPANGTALLVALLWIERFVMNTLGIGCIILFGSMMADVVEDSAVKTGRRSEGLFFSSMSVIQKMLSGAGNFLASILLQIVGLHAKLNPAEINPSVSRNLVLLYLPALLSLYGIGIVLLSRYRITRDHHQENVRVLSESQLRPIEQAVAAPPAE
jgi:Na+/melibiose symporter-like transporter